MSAFSEYLRRRTDHVWQAIFGHPFVVGIGAGDLSRDRYVYFLKQDYVYLIEFARFLSVACAKAASLADMTYIANLLHATLATEMELHRQTCAEFGISSVDLEQTQPTLLTTAYTSFLVKTGYEQTLGGIIAAMLPCAAGYVEIGQRLAAKRLPDDKYYRRWVETYSSAEFAEIARWLKQRLDDLATELPAGEKKRWESLYTTSTQFELAFFQMGWEMRSWPTLDPSVIESGFVPD